MSRTVGAIGTKYKADFEKFCRLEARGFSSAEIIEMLWGVKNGDLEYCKLKSRLSMWRNNPQYEKIWFEELGFCGRKMLTKGLRKINAQMDSETEWLSNKAANDAVNYAKARVFGESEKTITVKFEGMPDLGTPDQQE